MIDKTIETIASVHLGKAGDGTIVSPYKTPDTIDSSLLVAVPRDLNRVAYGITNETFVGYDMWQAYEVSALTDSGMPVAVVLRIKYPSDSECIVESKSLKLYLNSFNMVKLGPTKVEVRTALTNRVVNDLAGLLKAPIYASAHVQKGMSNARLAARFDWKQNRLEDVVHMGAQFTDYQENKDLLYAVPCDGDRYWTTSLLRSNCRVTNQPDWGDLFIYWHGRNEIPPEALLKYIVSLRAENHFHEEVVELIYKRLYDTLNAVELFVGACYTRRGGIDICPMRASEKCVLDDLSKEFAEVNNFVDKTMRQ